MNPEKIPESLREKETTEHILPKELGFTAAVKYLARIALNNETENPVLVSLCGLPNSGKSKFVQELHRVLDKIDTTKTKKIFYVSEEVIDIKDEFREFFTIKKGYEEEISFSMVVIGIGVTENSAVDLATASIFKKLPEIVLYIYNPKWRKPVDPHTFQKEIKTFRKEVSGITEVKPSEPEIIFVRNPKAKDKKF